MASQIYYLYSMSSNQHIGRLVGSVTVVDADGHLTGSNNVNGGADTFTVTGEPAGTFRLSGGYVSGGFNGAGIGDFRATLTGGDEPYFFSSNGLLARGTDVVSAVDGFRTINDLNDVTLTCFLPGTMIRTPEGQAAIERLAIGQLVSTADGSSKPVKWIGRQTIAPRFADPLKTAPICIKAGALDEDIPSRDLYISARHAMILDGNMVIAAALVNGRSVVRAYVNEPTIVYYHVELEEHAVIFANDAATETYCDNIARDVFDNGAEYKALYPDALPIEQMDLHLVKSQRKLPAATRKRLAARAAVIGGNVSKVA